MINKKIDKLKEVMINKEIQKLKEVMINRNKWLKLPYM